MGSNPTLSALSLGLQVKLRDDRKLDGETSEDGGASFTATVLQPGYADLSHFCSLEPITATCTVR